MKVNVKQLVNLSSILNIVVLIPVISVLLLDLDRVEPFWGVDQASRQILTSIYIAILFASIALFFLKNKTKLIVATTIFFMQIIYKTLTAVLVINAFINPVVLSNLAITAVHLFTLYTIFKHNPDLLK
jgi:hypothetical protein